jgi:CBS domain-containing protein
MTLKDVFSKRVVTAGPTDTLAFVASQMREHNVGSVVVLEKQRPVGIVTDRDLAVALGAEGVSRDAEARTVMSTHVIAVPEDTGIFTVTRYMKECGVRRLPVVDREDRVIGIVSMDDILRCLGRELENLSEAVDREMVTT